MTESRAPRNATEDSCTRCVDPHDSNWGPRVGGTGISHQGAPERNGAAMTSPLFCPVCKEDGSRTRLHKGACWMHGTQSLAAAPVPCAQWQPTKAVAHSRRKWEVEPDAPLPVEDERVAKIAAWFARGVPMHMTMEQAIGVLLDALPRAIEPNRNDVDSAGAATDAVASVGLPVGERAPDLPEPRRDNVRVPIGHPRSEGSADPAAPVAVSLDPHRLREAAWETMLRDIRELGANLGEPCGVHQRPQWTCAFCLHEVLQRIESEHCARLRGEATVRPEVNRFEVIGDTGRPAEDGRLLTFRDVQVELSYQDDGRTLKVFLKRAPATVRVEE
jgi:hypothetical protein